VNRAANPGAPVQAARHQAEQEKQQAERLRAQFKALGIDPDV